MTNSLSPPCPLCEAATTFRFHRVESREYWRCRRCELTFVPRRQHLSAAEELHRYRQHHNDPSDAGYCAFLDRLAGALTPRLSPGVVGLDYGSGPGPTLSVMLAEQGFRMRLYDPFFAPDDGALRETYDFITSTETIEHFVGPRREFRRLDALLRPGGWLGVMTQMQEDDATFLTWWYLKDPTHVCFYRADTMRWIAGWLGWRVEFPAPSITLFHKPARTDDRSGDRALRRT